MEDGFELRTLLLKVSILLVVILIVVEDGFECNDEINVSIVKNKVVILIVVEDGFEYVKW